MSISGIIGASGFNGTYVVDGLSIGVPNNLVLGPGPCAGTSTLNAIVLWNNTTGTLVKDSGLTIADLSSGGVIDHGGLSGLTDDDHPQYFLLAGRSGGQIAIGGTVASNNLTLNSTSNATKGNIIFGSLSAYSELNDTFGFGVNPPNTSSKIQINTTTTTTLGITIQGVAAQTADFIKIIDNISTTLVNVDSSGNLNMNGNRVIDIPTIPTVNTDAINEEYIQQRNSKNSVRVATTTAITLFGALVIDGVSAIVGDRVLVKNQGGTPADATNGIYEIQAGVWTRATDADTSAKMTANMYTFVEEGDFNKNTGWILITNNPITLGVTALEYNMFTTSTQFFTVSLSGTAYTSISTSQRGAFCITAYGEVDGSPSATFNISKATIATGPSISRITSSPGDITKEKLELRWNASSNLELHKDDINYDGTYFVKIT